MIDAVIVGGKLFRRPDLDALLRQAGAMASGTEGRPSVSDSRPQPWR